jgi:hypothetical protein
MFSGRCPAAGGRTMTYLDVEIGRVCDECGGSGELPGGRCGVCFGEGRVRRLLTRAEFREWGFVGLPPPGRATSETATHDEEPRRTPAPDAQAS